MHTHNVSGTLAWAEITQMSKRVECVFVIELKYLKYDVSSAKIVPAMCQG